MRDILCSADVTSAGRDVVEDLFDQVFGQKDDVVFYRNHPVPHECDMLHSLILREWYVEYEEGEQRAMTSEFLALMKMKDLSAIKEAMPVLESAVSKLEKMPELTETSDGRELLANWRWLVEALQKTFDVHAAESLFEIPLVLEHQKYFVESLVRLEQAKRLVAEDDRGFTVNKKLETIVKSLLDMLFQMNDYYVFSGLVLVGNRIGRRF